MGYLIEITEKKAEKTFRTPRRRSKTHWKAMQCVDSGWKKVVWVNVVV